MQIAKQKVYRHYTLLQKLKNGLPIERENREGEPFEAALQTQEPSIDDRLVTDALLAEIRLHLRGKPAVTQKIFYLFYNMEQTIPQIAAELQMTESNVKTACIARSPSCVRNISLKKRYSRTIPGIQRKEG